MDPSTTYFGIGEVVSEFASDARNASVACIAACSSGPDIFMADAPPVNSVDGTSARNPRRAADAHVAFSSTHQ